MPEPAFPREDVQSGRIKRLILVRILVVLLALVVAVARDRSGSEFIWPLSPTYYIIILAAILNCTYLLVFRHVRALEPFALVQIAADILMIGGLSLFTGGLDSVFNILFFVSIIAAGWVLPTGMTLSLAGLAVGVTAVVGVIYCTGEATLLGREIPALRSVMNGVPRKTLSEAVSLVFVHGIEIALVAFLFSKLMQRLRGASILNEEILENMMEGLIAIDRDRNVVYVNRIAREMLGLADDEDVRGRPVDSIPPIKRNEELSRVLKGQTNRTVDINLSSGADEGAVSLPVEMRLSVLKDRDGNCRGEVVLLADLTERHAMEHAMRRMARLEATSQMSTSIAHEVRNPLASISGSAQMLLEMGGLDEEGQRLLTLIVEESERLDGLVTDFMRFSRPQRVDPTRFSLRELVDEVALMLAQTRERERCELDVDIPKELDCRADRNLLKQVFYNLAINAFQAMSDGGRLVIEGGPVRGFPEGRLDFYGDGPPARVEGVSISFRDSGPGVSPELQEQLFTPFFTTKTRGTGVGLAIVERIVEAHKGQISLQSAPDRGAVFRIWIPRRSSG